MQLQLLNQQDAAALLQILLSSEDKPFTGLQQEFASAFAASDQFRACCAAVLLLEDATLLRLPQRLAGWFLLATCNQGVNSTSPFHSLLVKTAATPTTAPAERNFLLQVLEGSLPVEAQQSSPRSYASSCDFRLLAAAPADPTTLEQQLLARSPQPLGPSSAGWPGREAAAGALPDSTAQRPGAEPADGAAAARDGAGAAVRPGSLGLQPVWERPAPAVLTPFLSEVKWVNPDLHNQLLWDSSMGEEDSIGRLAAVRELVAKALRGPLLPAQQQQVLAELDVDSRVVLRLGLTPKHLPALVENAPVMATEVLLRLLKTQRAQEYLDVLAQSEMSLHSMEVVNRLTSSASLPTDFVHLYITNCINSCEAMQDKYVQSRLVRLVCVFLQSLIRNKVVHIHDLLHEVQAFCINFSRIREAAKLFRLLKQIEAGVRSADSLGVGGADVDDDALIGGQGG